MKKILYMALATAFIGLASCNDDFEGSNRFKDNPNPPVIDTTGYVKRVLVEDFTGQNCINCPDAAQMLAQLKEETYGDRMVLVAMHAGGLSLGTPLHNDVAQTYMTALGMGANNPAISIDRAYSDDGVYANWPNPIASRAAASTPCEVRQFVSMDGERTVSVLAQVSFSSAVSDSIGVQHWLVQDSIIDYQVTHNDTDGTPDGVDYNYVHNHVFRSCLYDDIWGVSLPTTDDGGYLAGQSYMAPATPGYTIPDDWDMDNLSIVSFVFRYSTDESNPIAEVLQTNITHLGH